MKITSFKMTVLSALMCLGVMASSTAAHAVPYNFNVLSNEGGDTCEVQTVCVGAGCTTFSFFDDCNGKLVTEKTLGVGICSNCFAALSASTDYNIACLVAGNNSFSMNTSLCSTGLNDLCFSATAKECGTSHTLDFCGCCSGTAVTDLVTIPANSPNGTIRSFEVFDPDTTIAGQTQITVNQATTPEPPALLGLLLGVVAFRRFRG